LTNKLIKNSNYSNIIERCRCVKWVNPPSNRLKPV